MLTRIVSDRGSAPRRWLYSCLVALLALAVLPAAASAETTQPLSVSKMTIISNYANGGCAGLAVFRFAVVPGATSYTADAKSVFYSQPFHKTSADIQDTYDNNPDWTAPAGTHQWLGSSYYQATGPCTYQIDQEWTISNAFAHFPGPVIKGRVLASDGTSPGSGSVKLTAPDNTTFTASIQADGSYQTGGLSQSGAYKVEVVGADSRQYCVAPVTGACQTSATVSVPPDATVNFQEKTPHIVGTVVQGSDGTNANDAAPAADVPVTVSGSADGGSFLSFSTTTGSDGSYDVPVRAGTWTVSFPDYACVRDVNPCTHSREVIVRITDDRVTVNAVVLPPQLETTISAPNTTLDQTKDDWVPKTVEATVTVKNNGTAPITNVHLNYDDLQIGSHGTPLYPRIPVKVIGKADRTAFGTLSPGDSASAKVQLLVSGDGDYDMSTSASGTGPLGQPVFSQGDGIIHVDGQWLTEAKSLDVTRPSQRYPGLIEGGSDFRIRLVINNRSYVHRALVNLGTLTLRGNAFGGGAVQAGDAAPALQSMAAAAPPMIVRLEPRERKDFQYVVHTTRSDAFSNEAMGPVGGTLAEASFTAPLAAELKRDDSLGDDLGPKQVAGYGEKDYRLHVDDSAPASDPYSLTGAVGSFTAGAFLGVLKFTGGTIKGFVYDLPILLAHGLAQAPTALLTFAQFEAEVGREALKYPPLMGFIAAQVKAEMRVAYANAPVILDKLTQASAAIDKAVYQHYLGLANNWYAGNWQGALEQFTEETTAGTADALSALSPRFFARIATKIAPGVAARAAPVIEALNTERKALQARGFAALRSVGAVSLRAATNAFRSVEVGTELSEAQLSRFYGYSPKQVRWLANYAKEKALIIVARDRQPESTRWLERGLACLKPERVKIKNVNEIDTLYLGFPKGSKGLVAIVDTRLLEESAVQARLRSQGVNPSDPLWQAVMDRRAKRLEELAKDSQGYVKDLEALAGQKKVTLNWNAADNVVDPSALAVAPVTYEFRLLRKGSVRYPQFKVNGKWRSVTGDMDLLAITQADGRPLTDAMRSQVYRDMAQGPLGLMHPESATWVKNGLFDFAEKTNEFLRSAIPPVQFGPDGKQRAVQIILSAPGRKDASYWIDKLNYRLVWDGGYRHIAP